MRCYRGHTDHVRCVAYSPDGALLATASNDRSVILLDARTGEKRRAWADLGGVMQTVAFSPDGEWVAFGGQAQTLSVQALSSNASHEVRIPILIRSWCNLTALVWIDSDLVLLTVGDRTTRRHSGCLGLYRLSTRTFSEFRLIHGLRHLALNPLRTTVALAGDEGLSFADAPTWRPQESLGGGYVVAVAYTPGGTRLVAAQGNQVIVLDAQTYQVQRVLSHAKRVTSIAVTPDSRHILTGSWDRTVSVWSVGEGSRSALDWQCGKVQYVAVAPDGMTASAACDKGVVVWDLD